MKRYFIDTEGIDQDGRVVFPPEEPGDQDSVRQILSAQLVGFLYFAAILCGIIFIWFLVKAIIGGLFGEAHH